MHTSLLEAIAEQARLPRCPLHHAGGCSRSAGQRSSHGDTHGARSGARTAHVNIAAPSDRMWKSFCEAVGADALFADERYDSVRKRRSAKAELNAEIEKAIADFPVEEVVGKLNAVRCPLWPHRRHPRRFRQSASEAPQDGETRQPRRAWRPQPDSLADQPIPLPPTRNASTMPRRIQVPTATAC